MKERMNNSLVIKSVNDEENKVMTFYPLKTNLLLKYNIRISTISRFLSPLVDFRCSRIEMQERVDNDLVVKYSNELCGPRLC